MTYGESIGLPDTAGSSSLCLHLAGHHFSCKALGARHEHWMGLRSNHGLLLRAGMALGMVMQLPEEADETSISKRQLLAKLDVCMGGRVAEELIFGESDITTGASSDIEQARPHSLHCPCVFEAENLR